MTHNQLLAAVAAVLTTVHESGPRTPQGPMYAALQTVYPELDLDRWQTLLAGLEQCGLVKTTSETVTLTPLGVEKAIECVAVTS